MHRRADVSRAALPRPAPASCGAMNSVRSSTHEELQRSVVWTLFRAFGQRRSRNGAHHRSATAIHHRHDHLRGARQLEDDPVDLRTCRRDLHEVACSYLLHRHSVVRPALMIDRRSSVADRAVQAVEPLPAGRGSMARSVRTRFGQCARRAQTAMSNRNGTWMTPAWMTGVGSVAPGRTSLATVPVTVTKLPLWMNTVVTGLQSRLMMLVSGRVPS
jgi:hypothetical protein